MRATQNDTATSHYNKLNTDFQTPLNLVVIKVYLTRAARTVMEVDLKVYEN